ncbi:MAG: PrgI family protein [Gemmiger sp.]|nr:PrgI family protein [Gemmiger sp.]MDY5784122.1 PrgI family protein [Gemmiger sp.]
MEIKIPKEIREYRESIFFGLTTRQFICSLLALGGAAGLQATIGRLQCWPFGASNRTSVPALLAGGPEARQAVGVYFLLQPYVGTEEIGWMCILAAAPFAACGFFRYHFKKQEVSPRKRSSKNRIPNSPGRRRPPVSPRPP